MSALKQALIFSVLLAGAFGALKKVVVSKCCNKDEFLTGSNLCLKNYSTVWDIPVFVHNTIRSYREKTPLNWQLRYAKKPTCGYGDPLVVDLHAKSFIPIINGSIFRFENYEIIHPEFHCIDYRFALVCTKDQRSPQPQSITSVVVKECCGDGMVYSVANGTCEKSTKVNELQLGADKILGIDFPTCADNKREYALIGKFNKSVVFNNGSIWVEDSKMLVGVGNFCLEHVVPEEEEVYGTSPVVVVCRDLLPATSVVVQTVPNQRDLRFIIYPVGLAIGVVFLAATLAAGSTLPANHHVLHWSCQTNHVACLLVGNVLLCITQLSGKMEYWPCFLIAFTMHFCFLAAFFWLNTMCFNIWWTFRDLRPQNTEKSQERLRLRLYEAYAWGIPFAISSIAATLDLVPIDSGADFMRPRFAKKSCWFYGDMEILTFFYGPIGILLFINLLLFALTARELTCGLWKRELVKSTTERAALGRVCMKLVVVMGITWIADLLSWAVGGPHYLWYATDIINCLQGVFIFVVVGLQPQVLAAVKRAWCLRKHRQNSTGMANHHSSSSQGMPSMGDTITNTNSVTNNTTKSVPLETSC